MSIADICELKKILGVIEGFSLTLPNGRAGMISDYLEVAEAILDREMEAACGK